MGLSPRPVNTMLTDWDWRYLELAEFVGRWSKDPSRKVGAVIVGPDRALRSVGYNGFPRRIDDNDTARIERPAKYYWTEHAERNAIYQAAKVGVPLENCTMYLPWYPCIDCARAIVQTGIKRLVAHPPDLGDSQWGEQFAISRQLLEEAAIEVELVGAEPSGT